MNRATVRGHAGSCGLPSFHHGTPPILPSSEERRYANALDRIREDSRLFRYLDRNPFVRKVKSITRCWPASVRTRIGASLEISGTRKTIVLFLRAQKNSCESTTSWGTDKLNAARVTVSFTAILSNVFNWHSYCEGLDMMPVRHSANTDNCLLYEGSARRITIVGQRIHGASKSPNHAIIPNPSRRTASPRLRLKSPPSIDRRWPGQQTQ